MKAPNYRNAKRNRIAWEFVDHFENCIQCQEVVTANRHKSRKETAHLLCAFAQQLNKEDEELAKQDIQ